MKRTIHLILAWIATVAIALAVLAQPWFLYKDETVTDLTKVWWNNGVEEFTQGWHSVDAVFAQARNNGDLAVAFPGLSPTVEADVRAAEHASHRGSYALYLCRLYTADDGVVITSGESILRTGFFPGVPWLQQHHVSTALFFHFGVNREFYVQYTDVPPAEPIAPIAAPAAAPSPILEENGAIQLPPWNPQQPAPVAGQGGAR